MIKRIKELMQVKDAIDKLTEKTNLLEKAYSNSAKEAEKLRTELQENHKENQNALIQAKKDAEALKGFRKDLKSELYEFKLFKKDMRKEFLEKIGKELSQAKAKMEKDVSEFNNAKKKLDTKLGDVEKLDSEIQRLQAITKNISAADFKLTKNHHELEKINKEKLELMRKIDSLERLVACIRRRR